MRSLQAKIVYVYLALAGLIVGLSIVALIDLDRDQPIQPVGWAKRSVPINPQPQN